MKHTFTLFLVVIVIAFSCKEEEICPPTAWYEDADNDGLGNPQSMVNSCEQPNGYVDNANDEDDSDYCEASLWYQDLDGDGLGNADMSMEACEQPEGYVDNATDEIDNTAVNFEFLSTIDIGGLSAAEISAYDEVSKHLFITNAEKEGITVVELADPSAPAEIGFIDAGKVNSVAAYQGKIAVAVQNDNKQLNGEVKVYDTPSLQEIAVYEVGALPDMVAFTPDGKYIVVANEGEPNDDYTIDPEGSISVIDLENGTVAHAYFSAFNSRINALRASGFRVFGPGASLAMDVEPEYVTVSPDSKTAWVTLQENNGIARIDLASATVTEVYPLGVKDHMATSNKLDASNKDDIMELKNWPVLGFYHPDALSHFTANGVGYLITANEGDSRDYDGYSEEERVKDLVLDPIAFPDAATLQEDDQLGRLKVTSAQGDIDGDGDYDILYSYGARSFSIWTETGSLVFDSGDDISRKTLEHAPQYFNLDTDDDASSLTEGEADGRSDDKGAEPESTAILDLFGERQIAFIGLERVSAVMVYDVSTPGAPHFLQWIQRDTDIAPEGLITVNRNKSPNGKDLLIVSNEVSGTVSIYQNTQ
ncbi:hypothetical protein GCM10007049_03190 [Echinicola pacifica]|uniref:Choice-of-anchor I domain-containing protein n=1 Tax=Echinicola pacifica TaxID=346377 RepID=A0A918PN72_9BACT|nr:choice-of-anchor I family protein [Echinicola pacifica]GGZ14646.1 hypothetical protein GCM10007049_03190 [Echinicola pacifica]